MITPPAVSSADVSAAVAALVAGAPGALNTLDEIAAALGDDANFAAAVTTALAGKQPLDTDLTNIAALATAAFGRSLLTLADAAALQALLTFPGAGVSKATSSLVTAGHATSFTDFFTYQFTPKGTKAIVRGYCSCQSVGGGASVRLAGPSAAVTALLLWVSGGPSGGSASAEIELTGLTPGTPITVSLQYLVDNVANSFYCRPTGGTAASESAILAYQDVLG